MSEFAIDCSIGIAWIHPGQATSLSAHLLDEALSGARLFVPSLWYLEIANALLVLERRKKITRAERLDGMGRLGQMRIVSDDEWPRQAFRALSEIASEHGLSVYDACYVELSLRRRLTLASHDEALKRAARRLGVALAG